MTPEEIDQLADALATKLVEKQKEQEPLPLVQESFPDNWAEPSSFTPPANSKLAQEKENDGIIYEAKGEGT